MCGVCASEALAEPQRLDGRLVDVKRAVPGEKVQEPSAVSSRRTLDPMHRFLRVTRDA